MPALLQDIMLKYLYSWHIKKGEVIKDLILIRLMVLVWNDLNFSGSTHVLDMDITLHDMTWPS
jgi:hypothetical protein